MSNHEPDFVALPFSVNNDDQIALWKEFARHSQQWDDNNKEEHKKEEEQLLDESLAKYGAPLGSLRLYDNGLVTIGLKRDALTAELLARSIKAGEDAWDEFYPEAAEAFRNASRELLASIDEQKAISQYLAQFSDEELHVKMMSTGGQVLSLDGTPVEEQLLKRMLETSAEKLAADKNPVLVGILTETGMAVAPFHIPYEKYRFARCISDVAKQVNAKTVLIVFDAYTLDDEGNRIGEVLLGTVFDPYGIARGCGMKYIRENDKVVLQDASEMCHLPGGNLCIRWKEGAAA